VPDAGVVVRPAGIVFTADCCWDAWHDTAQGWSVRDWLQFPGWHLVYGMRGVFLPWWFLWLLWGLLTWFVWRKTRGPKIGGAIPVEPALRKEVKSQP